MCAQSRQMNENSSANGIVTATISAVRTLNRKMPSTTSTSTMPRTQVALDGLGRLLDQIASGRSTARILTSGGSSRGSASSVISSTFRRARCACSPTRIRITPSTASLLFHVSRTGRGAARGRSPPSPTSLTYTGMPLCVATTMLPMSSSLLDQAEAADVVELAALRVEAAAGVGVVARRAAGSICGTRDAVANSFGSDRAAPGTASSCRRGRSRPRRPGSRGSARSSTQSSSDLQLLRRAIRALRARSGRSARSD